MTRSSAEAAVLVTGASGFIGRHLVDALLAMDRRIMILSRSASDMPKRWDTRVERIDCDDWSLTGLQKAAADKKFVCLYHLAAYGVHPGDRDPALMTRINADLAADLLRLCKAQNAGMLMAGSSAEYCQPVGRVRLTEQSPLEEKSLYGASKAAGTQKASALAHELGTPLRVLRLFNVYGPGEAPHRLLPNLVSGLKSGKRIALSAGLQVRDFIYVDDVVEAFLAASVALNTSTKTSVGVWNIGTGTGHTVRKFAETVAGSCGMSDELLGFGDLPMRSDEVPWLVSDPGLVRSQLGWVARHSLDAGINAAVAAKAGCKKISGEVH